MKDEAKRSFFHPFSFILGLTPEPEGEAAACKAAEVGSIPTGVSARQLPIRTTSEP